MAVVDPAAGTDTARAPLDWRIVLGLVLSVLWLLCGALYMFIIGDPGAFLPHNAADLGSFLQGVFAPLAFLWLVLGHFLQQSEISANTRAIELQEINTRRLELLSRRDSFFKLQELVEEQLGTIAFYLYISSEGSTGAGRVSDAQIMEERRRMDQGDPALFMRHLIWLVLSAGEDIEAKRAYFWGTGIRARHTRNYLATFEKLLRLAADVDEEEIIVTAIRQGSAMGRLEQTIRDLEPG